MNKFNNGEFMKSKATTYFLVILLSLSIIATFSSYSFGESGNLRTSQGKIFDGLYANYTYDDVAEPVRNSSFNYAYDSGDFYNVSWWLEDFGTETWLENIQTRIILNSTSVYANGYHTPTWVFTNLSIGDLIPIVVDGDFDHSFNVTDELTVIYPGFESLDVWVLEDLVYSNHAWYERNTGLLINGTFLWPTGGYIFTLTATNMFQSSQSGADNGVPSFEIFLILPIISIVSLIILRRMQKVLRIKE